jgi:hypothetical protein
MEQYNHVSLFSQSKDNETPSANLFDHFKHPPTEARFSAKHASAAHKENREKIKNELNQARLAAINVNPHRK